MISRIKRLPRFSSVLLLAASAACVVTGCASDDPGAPPSGASQPSAEPAAGVAIIPAGPSTALTTPKAVVTPPPPVAVAWEEDMGAQLFARTGALHARITSTRSAPLDIDIVSIERGAGEPAVRFVEHMTLAPGATRTLDIPIATLPTQNTDAPLPLQLLALFDEDGLARRNASPVLNVVLSRDGKTAYASGRDSYGPLVAAAAGRADDPRMIALLRGASPAHTERAELLAPTRAAMKSARSAAAVSGVHMGVPVSVPGQVVTQDAPIKFPPPPPPWLFPSNFQFCSTWQGTFSDSHYGEDYLDDGHWFIYITDGRIRRFWTADPHPARYADARVVDSQNTTVWHGPLDATGCTPTLALFQGDYTLDLQTTLVKDSTTYNIYRLYPYGIDYTCTQTRMRGSLECQEAAVTMVPFHVSATGTSSTVRVDVPPGPESSATRVAAVVGQILVTPDGAVNANDTYTVYADAGCPPGLPGINWNEACADHTAYFGNSIGIGHKDTTFEKFVIAHELGHQLQSHQGLLAGGGYTADPSAPDSCACRHVTSANALHCIQSRHSWLTASTEGWAHFISQMTFNDTARSNPTFVYYKEVRTDDGVVHAPPYPVNAGAPVRWLESHCPADDSTVEWDILTFLRALNGGGGSDALTMADILGTYRAATGGRHWSSMASGALAYFGNDASNPKYQRFLRAGAASGVTR